MKKVDQNNLGFTLIEVLLYLAIVSFFVVSITGLAWNVVSDKSKNDALAVVNDNSQVVAARIGKTIRAAKQISSPSAKGESASSLSLLMPNDTTTTFNISNNRLQIIEGSSDPVYLTSSKAVIQNLEFTNLSRDGTIGNIRVQLNISRYNPNQETELAAEIDIDTCFSLRNN